MTALDVWDARIERVRDVYPPAGSPITREVTARVVNGEELLARLLRDVLAVDNVAVRRGQRPDPDVDEGRRLLAELRGQDFTTEPFDQALRSLMGHRSLAYLARMSGLSKANLSRLINRRKTPRLADMEAVATGFGKKPMYFAEYRAAFFAELVRDRLHADPDRSAVLAHQLGLSRD